jgi:hypothetical protein
MQSTPQGKQSSSKQMKIMAGVFLASALCFASMGAAQDRDHDRDRDRITTLLPGTVVPVRTNEAIDVDKGDYRVYRGIVDQDVRGNDGRLAIPRGATAEMIVRFSRDNDMVLDIDSITVNGVRYAPKTYPKRIESRPDNSVVGSIVGAINGGEVRGRAVRVPRDTVVTFRLQQPLDMGIADRGIERNGYHYHDYERENGGW